MNLFHHEEIYRGKGTLAKIKDFPIVICGVGAIGSNLAENLVRQGFANLTVIDKDRIEDRNINTQVWTKREIGMLKVATLKYHLFEIMGIEINSSDKELKNMAKFKNLLPERLSPVNGLIIDAFDNSRSRLLIKETCSDFHFPYNCLHIGFNEGYGEIIWNEDYRVPDDKGVDDCDYPLARNLIMLLVAIASEVIIKFIDKQKKENYTITLKDFRIEKYIP